MFDVVSCMSKINGCVKVFVNIFIICHEKSEEKYIT